MEEEEKKIEKKSLLSTQKLSKKQSKNVLAVQYPSNINVKDFLIFMFTPWLVYDVYPRRDSISIMYIIKKSFCGLTSVLICYIVYTEYILPTI